VLASLVAARVHRACSVLRRRCARRGMQFVVHRFKLVELVEYMRMKETDQFSTAVIRPIAIRSATVQRSEGEFDGRVERTRDVSGHKANKRIQRVFKPSAHILKRGC
jgi:hypothetical protein